jgi:predicted small secreted protein
MRFSLSWVLIVLLLLGSFVLTGCNSGLKPGADLSGKDLSERNLKEKDLHGANLIGADLQRAELNKANLSGVSLSGANLSRAHLDGADLTGADLKGADLSRARLKSANLAYADLTGANLTGANLEFAHLESANLNEADLTQASLQYVKLDGANVAGAKILETNLSRVEGLTEEMLKSSGVGGPISIEVLQGHSKICEGGGGIARTTPYDKEAGSHPVLLLKRAHYDGNWYYEKNSKDIYVAPSEMYLAQIVVCMHYKDHILQTCSYASGSGGVAEDKVQRIRREVEIQVLEAKTGEVIETALLVGTDPEPCETIVSFPAPDITGDSVPHQEIKNWLETHVESLAQL